MDFILQQPSFHPFLMKTWAVITKHVTISGLIDHKNEVLG